MEALSYSVELHLHTCYSFLEGASLPEEMALEAAKLGYRALAVVTKDRVLSYWIGSHADYDRLI